MIYTSACVDEARVMAESMENATGRTEIAWTDDDTTFDLQLEKFGINTIALSTIVIPKRRFVVGSRIGRNHYLNTIILFQKPNY